MQHWHLLKVEVKGESFITGSNLLCTHHPPTSGDTLSLEIQERATDFTVTVDDVMVTGSVTISQYEYKIDFLFTREYGHRSYLTGVITRTRLLVEVGEPPKGGEPDDIESATGITDCPWPDDRKSWKSWWCKLFARRR